MKYLAILFIALSLATTASAQGGHALQGDDGLGHFFLITGNGLNTPLSSYTLAPGGGQILTTSALGSVAWMLGGNTGSAPNNLLGTLDNTSLIFVTGSGGPNNRMTIDGDGDVGINIIPTTGVVDSKLTLLQSGIVDPLSTRFNATHLQQNLSPSGTWTTGSNNLYIRSDLYASSSNVSAVMDGIRQELLINPNYTGVLDYAQGGNFAIGQASPTTVANIDAMVGSIYNQGSTAANNITNARGAAGQVLNLSPGTITNAWAHWANLGNFGTGTITNAYLFGALNPSTAGITNLYGLYIPQLTGATNITAIRYDHPTRPFVVDGNGSVGVDMNPQPGVALAVGTGSSGHPLVRVYKTNAASQYASIDFSPFGAITAANPRWGSGVMGLSFPNQNYSIWSFDGAIDQNRLTIDPTGQVGINSINAIPNLYSQFSVYKIATQDLVSGNINTHLQMDVVPAVTLTQNAQTLNLATTIANSAQNITSVVAGVRQSLVVNANYTGTASYLQGGNFGVYNFGTNGVANIDGVASVAQVSSANGGTFARGVASTVYNTAGGTLTSAYGYWSRVASISGSPITNAYLFYGNDPAAASITNLYGVYIPQLTSATNIFAFYYAHPTSPFAVTGTGSVGVGTSAPASLFSVGAGSKLQVDANGDLVKINNIAYTWPSAHVSTFNAGYLESNTSGTLTWRNSVVVSSALTFNNTASGGTDDQTITVSGAASGDVVSLGIPNGAMPAGMAWYQAWVSAANTVSIRFYNQTGAAQQPSGTFTVKVTH